MNQEIRSPEIRVLDEDGTALGIMDVPKALSLAKEKGLDLIEIAPKANPPVCRIMDYGKYLYHKAKQDRIQKAKQKKVEMKGVRLSVRTGQHDLEFKAKKVQEFLDEGDKVKIDMVLKGREKAHFDFAEEKLKVFLALLGTVKYEQVVKRTPQGLVVIISR